MSKTYLGDSVYVDFDGYSLILTTENGIPPASNTIVLEPGVYQSLLGYVDALARQQADRPHLHDVNRTETCWCGAAPNEPHTL